MPKPGNTIGDEDAALFDRLAALTEDPDGSFGELTTAYGGDARLTVPPVVFSAVLQRTVAV
jgi:hypothetical protein